MTTTVRFEEGSDLPALALDWRDSAGAVIDFSEGWTFTFVVARGEVLFTKTTGITGAATAPNVVVDFGATERRLLARGAFDARLTAQRADGKRRVYELVLLIE
jgi:hypothetical protein